MFEIFDEIIIELYSLCEIYNYLSEHFDLMQRSIDRASIILDSFEW